MIEVRQTETFRRWWTGLKDKRVVGLIFAKLDRLAYGYTGDVKPVGHGLSELRIHYGPGYRVYFQRRGAELVVLLCGGDKGSQARDIQRARRLAETWSGRDDSEADTL